MGDKILVQLKNDSTLISPLTGKLYSNYTPFTKDGIYV